MNRDDVIYLALLAFSMCFGLYYRRINDHIKKKYIGASLGFLIVLIVSRVHIIHVLITTIVNGLLILYTDRRKCQVYVFSFSFLYLFFFRTTAYFGIPYPPSHTNLVQMMLILKIIGLAFEVNSSYQLSLNKGDAQNNTDDERLENETFQIKDIGFLDICCYLFCYCGVLTGPYFTYRTYVDHLHKPYHKYDDMKGALLEKLTWLPLLITLHLVTNHYWPLYYVETEEFLNRSFFYRYWYIWPSFLIFRSRIYIGLILTEIVCIFAGFGVYPTFTEPKAGHGPTKNFRKLKEMTPEDLKSIAYDYETIHCVDVYKADCVPTMREAMKYWNITIQYWLAAYVYKKFPYKKYRTMVTMLVSSLWHGVYAGYYFCIGTVPFGLLWEDVWAKLLLEGKTGTVLKLSSLIMLFFKMQLFSYQATAFVLLEIRKIIHYYNCVYHCIPILYTAMYFLGKYILKQKKLKQKTTGKVE
ncbi:unnamed protein product [Acanthoscelides obtectus]|uniref:Lysophospholipid acyltransferase 7 n=2 Tax=Acanthoscelides obtectus TaxID=200917 RepID=A0A9P0KZM8_ACAOB|nr:unnamed protein product [Acanthoscelides obtectus]CAK1630056.1 Lysophospholipid acyltransferase 7 [Acanthoscelides obtectus]